MNKPGTNVIAAARRRKHWTQLDLAQRVGCSESQIAKLETGRAMPNSWLKDALATQLGIASRKVAITFPILLEGN